MNNDASIVSITLACRLARRRSARAVLDEAAWAEAWSEFEIERRSWERQYGAAWRQQLRLRVGGGRGLHRQSGILVFRLRARHSRGARPLARLDASRHPAARRARVATRLLLPALTLLLHIYIYIYI